MHNEIFTDFSADLRTCRPCFFCQPPQISKLSGHPAIRDRLLIPQKVPQGSFFPKQSRTLQVSAQRFLKRPASLLGTPTAVYELSFPKGGIPQPELLHSEKTHQEEDVVKKKHFSQRPDTTKNHQKWQSQFADIYGGPVFKKISTRFPIFPVTLT